MKRVVLAFGTRPEAIKMAPVYRALNKIRGIEPLVLLTGQHREQLDQALSLFDIPIAADLNVMTARQTLTDIAERVIPKSSEMLKKFKAEYVLVHGDTLTTFAVAWVSFLEQIRVGHVEAGLRTGNLKEPFPEEANRRLTDAVTDLDLAPTPLAKSNLVQEGKKADGIVVTGQTGIDAVLYAAQRGDVPAGLPQGPLVTVTLHRRENWPLLDKIAAVLARIAHKHPQFTFVFPVHKNPEVGEKVEPALKSIANVKLLPTLEYGGMAALLAKSSLIVTDSGGLQEEGAALDVPVVVVRNVTERPEGVKAGKLQLAGTDPEAVFYAVDALLAHPEKLQAMRAAENPYGDGRASERVAQAVAWRLGLAERPQDWQS